MRHYAKALPVTLQSASSVEAGSGVSRLNECRLRISLRWHCDTLLGFRRIAQRLRHAWARHLEGHVRREAARGLAWWRRRPLVVLRPVTAEETGSLHRDGLGAWARLAEGVRNRQGRGRGGLSVIP